MSFIAQAYRRYRYSLILLRQLVITDFKLRYQSSVLGYVWSLLKPIMLFGILYVVFSVGLRFGESIEFFAVYLLLGIVVWLFFAEASGTSVSSIVARGDILRKINFPRYVVILSVTFSAAVNFFINMLVVVGFMVINGVEVRTEILWLIPLLVQLFAAALSVSFFLSAAYVKFRDISHIWEVILQGAFYGTPILYALGDLPEKAQQIMLLNPMAQIIQDIRYVMITPDTVRIEEAFGGSWMRVVPIGLTVLMSIIAATYFRKRSKSFAEEL